MTHSLPVLTSVPKPDHFGRWRKARAGFPLREVPMRSILTILLLLAFACDSNTVNRAEAGAATESGCCTDVEGAIHYRNVEVRTWAAKGGFFVQVLWLDASGCAHDNRWAATDLSEGARDGFTFASGYHRAASVTMDRPDCRHWNAGDSCARPCGTARIIYR